MNGELISVIIPAYNVQKYIRRCLDSLVSQTYKDLEIIVVNDGSTDRTRAIVEEYAERYPGKVILYNQENQGQAQARNFGLTKATGKYIGFVDSDDFVSTKMYELMYREAKDKGCDLVTCGYYGCDDVTGEITVYQTGYKGEFNQSIYENPLILRVNSPYPWNKLYARELLERTSFAFRKGMIFEDLCAVFPLFMDAKKVGRVHEKLYYYIKGRKGGTISTFTEKHGQIIDALEIMNDAYRERGLFTQFYDTLLFFNLRHIFARFDEMKTYDDIIFKREFKKRAFAHLDRYFSGWKESEEYRALEEEKEEHTDAMTQELVEEPVAETVGEQPVQESKAVKKATGKKRRAVTYEEYWMGQKVDKKKVLIECYRGSDVRGMGYYIAKDLAEHSDFEVYLVGADADKIRRFEECLPFAAQYVDINSEQYLELLATAGYLINNRAFHAFFRKRKEQRFIFTDFLPSLMAQGKESVRGADKIQGIQLSLAQADAILFPEELREKFVPLLEKYNMDQICKGKGCFFPMRGLFADGSGQQHIHGVKVAYMPNVKEFPGLKDSRDYLFISELRKKLTELDEKLEDGQTILFCFPKQIRRRFKKNIWKHIEFFPKGVETWGVLSQCQGMIGGYGAELYLMKALGCPVCQFADDQEDMAWIYGKTKRPDRSEVEVFQTGEEVVEWLNHITEKEIPEMEFRWGTVLRGLKRGKNRRIWKKVVYMPAFSSRSQFREYMEKQDIQRNVYFIPKDQFSDEMAVWISEYENMHYMVILQSIVVSEKEKRLIDRGITTREKLREKRDRQRYLG